MDFLLQTGGALTQSVAQASASTGAGQGDLSGEWSSQGKSDTDSKLDGLKGSDTGEHGLFSAALNSQGPSHASSARPGEVILDRSDRVAEKMINQIVRDVKLNLKNENTQVTMRLDPPELGALKVEIVSQGGMVTANIRSGSTPCGIFLRRTFRC
jgi:flagellar hook-length control protein FliK